ncbi:MAG: flagellar basal body rod protein FlgB [Burkholderiales bacterium]|nr:flagellar basal body rod protein FlgB [Burkholderiales bacterium]
MIGKLDEALSFHSTALRLRAERQQLLAANIANADTPGYKAVDFDFGRALARATGRVAEEPAARGAPGAVATGGPATVQLSTTAPGHVMPSVGGMGGVWQIGYRAPAQAALDGNSVDLDAERARFADNALRYEASLRFLNGQMRSMLSAING